MSQVILFSGPQSNRHEDGPYVSCCGDFSEVSIKSFIFSLQGFKKKDSFFNQVIPSKKRLGGGGVL